MCVLYALDAQLQCDQLLSILRDVYVQVKKSYEAKRAKRKAQGRTDRNWRLARLPMEVLDLSVVNYSDCSMACPGRQTETLVLQGSRPLARQLAPATLAATAGASHG